MALASCALLVLVLLLVWVSGHGNEGGAIDDGDSQTGSDGRDGKEGFGGSNIAKTASKGDADTIDSTAIADGADIPTAPPPAQPYGDSATAPTFPISQPSAEDEMEAPSSSSTRPYEFFTQRSSVASRPESVDEVGREADFFGVAAGGRRFVYVVDKSSSMSGERFEMAREELLRSLNKLKPNQSFFVIFYDDVAYPQPSKKLAPARISNVRRMSSWVKNAVSQGGTAPMDAIERAINFEPDAIFILSDGEFDQSVVTQTTRLNEDSPVRIHTIGFQNNAETLRAIAEQNNGTYRFVP
jgi:hypothetical protein